MAVISKIHFNSKSCLFQSEEYEDDVPADVTDEDAEDPKVIKELIDLIKKVGK